MQTYKHILTSILSVRKLAKPNAKPLYSYKVTAEEFESLKQTLISSVLRNGIHTYANKATREWAGCFVLYAAEWWRTSFQGGVWAWEPVLESLDLPANAISPTQRSEIVVKGLSFWGRKVLSNTKGRMLLGTVAVEGGLPQTLIQDPNSKLAHYFEQVIQDYGQFANSRLSAASIAKAHAHYIAASYRDETVYSIVAQVAESIYYLLDKHGLDEQSDPLHYLNTVDANWSQNLPLNMDPEAARMLLGNALGLAVEVQRRLPNSIKILRSLRRSYSYYAAMLDEPELGSGESYQWQTQVDITLKSRLNVQFLQQLFGSENLAKRINIFAVGRKSLLLAKAFKRGTESEHYLLDVYTTTLPEDWFDCDIQLRATDDLGNEWFAPVQGGAGFDANEPWVFTQHNDEWLIKGSGSITCEELSALVSVPEQLSNLKLASVGQIKDRILYEANAQIGTEFYFGEYCVSLQQEGAQLLEYNLVGQSISYQTNPSKCFVGVPNLVAIDETGQQKVIASTQLRWRNTILEQWQTMSSVPFGKVDFALFENNKPVKRFSVGLMPEDFVIDFQPSNSVQIGQIGFYSKGALPSIALKDTEQLDVLPSSVLSYHQEGEDEAKRTLDMVCNKAHPPAQINVSLWWQDQSKSLSLTLPFPAKGICLIGTQGEAVRNAESILVDKLSRYELFGYGVNDSLEVEFKLQARDVYGTLLKVAYVKRSLPKGDVLSTGFSLATFKEDIESLFALSSSLDATVKVSVLDSAHTIFNFNVNAYSYALIPNKELGTVDVKNHDSIGSLSMVPLDNPTFAPITLLKKDEYWHFPDEDVAPGAWLIYANDAEQGVRPLMWSKNLELLSSPSDRLQEAAAIGVRKDRLKQFSVVCGQLAVEFNAPEWAYIKGLLAFDSVPLTSFDLWSGAISQPEFMLAMLLTANKKETERIWQFSQQFPFLWHALKVRDAISVISAFYAWRIEAYGNDFSDIICGQIESKLDDLVTRHQGLQSLKNLLMYKINPSRDKPSLNPAAYMQQLFDLRNELNNRYDESHWPCEFADQILTSVISSVNEQLSGVCFTTQNLYRNNVMNAPVLLALSTCGSASLRVTPEVVHAMRQYNSFDSDYFEHVFALTHQMIFGLVNS
ncbi:STY4851/ECs_5259 family protein [Vibrio fluvialis]|uniref:STY4851/ECs_5259 family protein n=1 Tax=Vibrio fluvialis TaxID=676 RepID=UPI001EEC5609|nr:STY4851/ECs_5259 family protein [Vibrio fluvialis]MCG6399331.1 STY4851/ECs_5259 family protein [Vibrio fluvialis]